MKDLPGSAGEDSSGEVLTSEPTEPRGNEALGTPAEGCSVGSDVSSIVTNVSTYTRPPIGDKYGVDNAGRRRQRVTRAVLTDLPAALERISGKSLRMLEELISLPVARVSDARLRAMVTGAGVVLGTKVRVDEGALRVKHDNDVLDRLERLIKDAKRVVPQRETEFVEIAKESKE